MICCAELLLADRELRTANPCVRRKRRGPVESVDKSIVPPASLAEGHPLARTARSEARSRLPTSSSGLNARSCARAAHVTRERFGRRPLVGDKSAAQSTRNRQLHESGCPEVIAEGMSDAFAASSQREQQTVAVLLWGAECSGSMRHCEAYAAVFARSQPLGALGRMRQT
jgi:hypothetical protein